MIHMFLATGFEEIEALATLDILRRFGLEVATVSITGSRLITGAHGISVMADSLFRKKDVENSDAMILPGGMPGAKNLLACDALSRCLIRQYRRGALVAAICAAPMVLGELGILEGKKATCYFGFEKFLKEATYLNELVVCDANVITGKGPGAAIDFAFAIAERFVDRTKLEQMKVNMILS